MDLVGVEEDFEHDSSLDFVCESILVNCKYAQKLVPYPSEEFMVLRPSALPVMIPLLGYFVSIKRTVPSHETKHLNTNHQEFLHGCSGRIGTLLPVPKDKEKEKEEESEEDQRDSNPYASYVGIEQNAQTPMGEFFNHMHDTCRTLANLDPYNERFPSLYADPEAEVTLYYMQYPVSGLDEGGFNPEKHGLLYASRLTKDTYLPGVFPAGTSLQVMKESLIQKQIHHMRKKKKEDLEERNYKKHAQSQMQSRNKYNDEVLLDWEIDAMMSGTFYQYTAIVKKTRLIDYFNKNAKKYYVSNLKNKLLGRTYSGDSPRDVSLSTFMDKETHPENLQALAFAHFAKMDDKTKKLAIQTMLEQLENSRRKDRTFTYPETVLALVKLGITPNHIDFARNVSEIADIFQWNWDSQVLCATHQKIAVWEPYKTYIKWYFAKNENDDMKSTKDKLFDVNTERMNELCVMFEGLSSYPSILLFQKMRMLLFSLIATRIATKKSVLTPDRYDLDLHFINGIEFRDCIQ